MKAPKDAATPGDAAALNDGVALKASEPEDAVAPNDAAASKGIAAPEHVAVSAALAQQDAPVPEDAVAGVLRQWAAVRPDMDLAPIAVLGRINRCAALLQRVNDGPLGRAELSRPEFDLLSALRRVGGELTPSRLARETFASPAAVTKRVRGLEQRGLVERRADNRDRRIAHLTLTDAGRDLIDRIMPQQLSYERALLSRLPGPEQADLARILGDLLLLLEGQLGSLDY
jgi:DNA-binding MarR family transcriptional regulator